jgi:hypothetical protein
LQAIEVFNIVFTSLSWLILIYPIILLVVIVISVQKHLGYRFIFQRMKDEGILNALKNSLLFEVAIGLVITIIIPTIIVTCFPDSIIFTIYELSKPQWTITPFMIIFFLVDIPLTLLIGLYVHNTHGMIFVMYSIPFGYLITWLIDQPNVFEITPPYLILAAILWCISWASSGQLKAQKRVGYACYITDNENIESIISSNLENFAKSLNQSPKKHKIIQTVDFKGSDAAISENDFSGAFAYDYMIKYVPLAVMFRRLFNKSLGVLKTPYAFSIKTMSFDELVQSKIKSKYFMLDGKIYEIIVEKPDIKLKDLSSDKNNFNDIVLSSEKIKNPSMKITAILPTCSDIVNAFFFTFGTIKIRLVTTIKDSKKKNFLFSYIWAPGSLVPTPLAYIALDYVVGKIKDNNHPIWLFNFTHDLGSKYMTRFSPEPVLESIKPLDFDEYKDVAKKYVESETSIIMIRKRVTKAIVVTLSVISSILTITGLFGLFT